MSKMDNNHRYRPYHRPNRRYDDDCKHQYKKPTKSPYRYSSHHDQRNYNDLPYRRSYKNDYHYRHQPPKSKTFSYFSSPPPPLMSANISPPPSLMSAQVTPPPPPPPPAPLLSVVPHERDSWIRSVKKTKTNESTEQKTQYLETMLRMPQQKSLLKSSRFDRMRFADDQLCNSLTSTTPTNTDHLEQNSFHLIDDINHHNEICTLERILFDNELKSLAENSSSLPQSRTESNLNTQLSCSGFLIDNCDEEEEELPPFSPLPPPPLPPSSDELLEQNDEGRVMLVSELNAADAERKQELKRQKRLHRKLQKKRREAEVEKQPTTSTEKEESLSDWILEYDVDQVSRLTDEVRRTSITMTNEDKTERVNLILLKIKKQQEELKKLRQYVMSMLGEEEKAKSSKHNRSSTNLSEDLLLAFLNQPTQSGCWLCSGKMYAEVATQCDDNHEQ